jgi:serine/threonine protein kinase
MQELSSKLKLSLAEAGWFATESIGEGGGGEVFRCFRSATLDTFQPFIPHAVAAHVVRVMKAEEQNRYDGQVIDRLYQRLILQEWSVGALKVPHKVADSKSIDRLKREVKAMASVDHPALIKLVASDTDEIPGWFVMQYHTGGTLANQAYKYEGKPLEVLRAVRPIVDGLVLLHKRGFVHRDIKPGNIFIASDGHLVLGDFGIVFTQNDDRTRITNPGDLEFSRDWVPDWVRHRPIEDFPRSVDVFMLAKVIYFLVSGGKKVLATHIDEPDFDLRKLFPHTRGMDLLYDFLVTCITPKEKDCKIKEAHELLEALDDLESQLVQKPIPQLVLSLFETHSLVMIPIPMTGGMGHMEMFSGLIYVPRGSRQFVARARAINNAGSAFRLRIKLDKLASNEIGFEGEALHPGRWTEVLELETPHRLNEDWFQVTIEGSCTCSGSYLSAFSLYAK